MFDNTSVQPTAYPFSERERARLEMYRAAVRAGYFNEGNNDAAALASPPWIAELQEHSHRLGTDLSTTHV